MSILADTSYFVGLVNTKDKNHSRVVDFTRQLREPLIVPQPVLPEICYLLATRLGHSVMRRFVAEVAASSIEIETVTHEDLRRVAEILTEYADARLDFVDATLVAIAERRGITQVLTFDHRDFSIIRPRHSTHFELLP